MCIAPSSQVLNMTLSRRRPRCWPTDEIVFLLLTSKPSFSETVDRYPGNFLAQEKSLNELHRSITRRLFGSKGRMNSGAGHECSLQHATRSCPCSCCLQGYATRYNLQLDEDSQDEVEPVGRVPVTVSKKQDWQQPDEHA